MTATSESCRFRSHSLLTYGQASCYTSSFTKVVTARGKLKLLGIFLLALSASDVIFRNFNWYRFYSPTHVVLSSFSL
jgi:hypothetical protein